MIKERIKHQETQAVKTYTSLRLSMLSTLLCALGIGIALFFASKLITNRYVRHEYMSEEKKTERAESYVDDLQKYVTEHGLSCEDTAEISKWAQGYKYLYVLIYMDDKLLFESGRYEESAPSKEESTETDDTPADTENPESASGTATDSASGITVKTPTREELISEAISGGSHPIVTKDGVLLASMVDYTEYLYYDIFNFVSVFIGILGFVLVMWFYFFEITKRITKLGKEVTAVADGDTTRQITAEGEDEITRLCTDVEYMRSSMLKNIEKEHAALEANRELITAMSHDIRTPLTVLLGYIDIMKLNAPEGDMQQYIEASERTALRLKKMSDDMFSYFLVYGGGIEVSVQECDARTLIDQMLSGHVFLLREQGYTIDFNFENEENDFLSDTVVVTDPPQLMRIVENIFSNVMKYADKDKPVSIFVGAEVDEMTIQVSNSICANPDEAQKNGIGLRSCMKLANAMDVRFSSQEEDGAFVTRMFVPIIPEIAYGETEIAEEGRGFVRWFRSILKTCKSFFVKLWKKIKSFVLSIISKIKKPSSKE